MELLGGRIKIWTVGPWTGAEELLQKGRSFLALAEDQLIVEATVQHEEADRIFADIVETNKRFEETIQVMRERHEAKARGMEATAEDRVRKATSLDRKADTVHKVVGML